MSPPVTSSLSCLSTPVSLGSKVTLSLFPFISAFAHSVVNVLKSFFSRGGSLLSGIFMQLCKTIKKRQLAHVFVYRIGHVDFAEQFRQWYLL